MHGVKTQRWALALAIATATLGILQFTTRTAAQTGEGWITLLDSKTMGDWNQVGESNWRLEDGAVVADKRTGKDTAHLVSKNAYKNFQIHVEFWASDDANSGIFLRCQDPTKITTGAATRSTSSIRGRTPPMARAASCTSPR